MRRLYKPGYCSEFISAICLKARRQQWAQDWRAWWSSITSTPPARRALSTEPLEVTEHIALIDLIETVLVYKFPQLWREEIRAMLHLPETDLKQTRFYQEVFLEERQEGWQEGRQEALRSTAMNLIRSTGLDDAAIAAATGLEIEVVSALRRSPSTPAPRNSLEKHPLSAVRMGIAAGCSSADEPFPTTHRTRALVVGAAPSPRPARRSTRGQR